MLPILFAFLFITAQPVMETGNEQAELQQLFDDHWQYMLQSNPLFATAQGVHHYNDQLPDTDLDAAEQSYHKSKEFLERLEQIKREGLDEGDQLNYDIFQNMLENSVRAYELNDHLLPLNGWWDYHASFANIADDVPLETVEDYQDYLERLAAFPEYNGGYIERMRRGIEMGIVRPKIVFNDYVASIEALISDSPEEHRLFNPFEEYPEKFSDEEKARLSKRAKEVLADIVIPEYARLRNFLVEEYIPNTTETIGITEIPGGMDYYDYLIQFTGLALMRSPESALK